MRLLIVDDSELVREQIKNELAENFSDFEFEVASTGIEALEKQRRFDPDAVFLDYVIPAPDGIAVLEILTRVNKNIKIVMASSLSKQNYVYTKCVDCGAFAILTKPITKEELLKTFRNLQKNIGMGERIEKSKC